MIGFAFRGCVGKRIRSVAVATGSRHLENSNLSRKRTRASKFFSSSAKKEPKFSNRNKRDLFILAVGTCGAFGYHILHRNSNWDQDVWIIQNKLIASATGQKRRTNILPQDGAFLNRPPPVVLRFIKNVLSESGEDYSNDSYREHSSWPIASAKQSGEFYASKQWPRH